MRRLRPLSEAECYCRLYGGSDDAVRVFRIPPREEEADETRLTGERLRRLFEHRLDLRENGLAA